MSLLDHFKATVVEELDQLNGTNFEALCKYVIEIITDQEFELKGHNLEMKPVRGSVDLIPDDGYRIIGQCGTDKDYFAGDKPVRDVEGSIKNSPNFTTIYLFCNRRAKGNEDQNVQKLISDKLKVLKKTGYHFHLYDSQKIAQKIYNNIYKTNKIKKILEFLPKSYEYYMLLPQTNEISALKNDYKHRPEEVEIIKILETKNFIQIYGLSGIGKSQISIAIANILSNQFDTVLWFDGTDIQPNDLHNVNHNRMGENINLATLLETFKALIIIDNFNDDIPIFLANFNKCNKKSSKCIVSSLQSNVSHENSYNLTYISDEVSKEILVDCKVRPSEDQIEQILKNISGYPLLLVLSKNAVENGEMSWEDIINESNMTEINDVERNDVFAQRIVGRYKDRLDVMFNLLIGLNNTNLSKPFLRENSTFRFNDLLKFAILQDVGDYRCQIHQVVLSAIKAVVGYGYSNEEFLKYLQNFLTKHISARDGALYTFIAYHKEILNNIASSLPPNDSLHHSILLSEIYSIDTFHNPSTFIDLINNVQLNPERDEIDLRLFIERFELEQCIARQYDNAEKDKLRFIIESNIKQLNELHLSSITSQALRYHHIGKWLSSIKEYGQSESSLQKALELNPKSYHSLLCLARNYIKQKLFDKVPDKIKAILDENTILDVPLSVRLSAYDLIAHNNFKDLRSFYIDNHLDQFISDIHGSLSDNYSHTYIVLAKLAEHLSYNFPEKYSNLCIQLPNPLNIDTNNRLRKDYGKIKLAQYLYGHFPKEYRAKLFTIVEEYLIGVSEKDDYIRKDLIKLYLSAQLPEKALNIANELNDRENIFNLQLLCKVYCENGVIDEALNCINRAIEQENPSEKHYCAAFRHDKAKCLYKNGDAKAIDIMNEAIALQPNPKIIDDWKAELASWEQNKKD